jgi:CRP-like cAMP-binding protein
MATKAEKLLAKGQALEKKGKRDKALDVYRDACRAEPYDPDLWTARADAARALGMTGEAAEALFHVCDLFARSGMPGEALDVVKRVLALEPEHHGAKRLRRILEQRLGLPVTMASGPMAPVETPAPVAAPAAPAKPARSAANGEPHRADEEPPEQAHQPEQPDQEGEPELAPRPGRPSAQTPMVIELEADEPEEDALLASPHAPPRPAPAFAPAAAPAPVPETGGDSLDALSLVDRLPSQPTDGAGRAASEISLDNDGDNGVDVVQAVASTLSASPLLSELDSDLVRQLIDCGKLVQRGGDEVVFRQGQLGSSLFLILSGEVSVLREGRGGEPPRELARLRPGAFFGEMALLTNIPRTATVTAAKRSDFLEISRKSVRELVDRDPRVLKLLMRFFRARLVGTLLQTSPLFKGFSREERRQLVAQFRLRELAVDQVVIREGATPDGLFIVLVGKLEVMQGDDLLLGTLTAGDVFGEMSLLDGSPAMATVRTRGRSWVLVLGRADYHELATRHPHIRDQLMELADQRRARNLEITSGAPVPEVAEGRLEPV